MTVVLVTGAAGQVGLELQRRSWPEGVRIAAPARAALDLGDPAAVGAYLAGNDVSAVINAAAYTAVDKAETDVAAAYHGNALVPAALAQATREHGVPLVHVSTDYVFDGSGVGAYGVDDPIRPLSVYGASKAAGEWAVRMGNPRSAVVRTAWVVSPHRGNFVKTMLRLGGERDALNVVADQHGAPTIAADLADALGVIALRMIEDADAPTGVFHFTNAGPTTWHGFAAAIFEAAAAQGRTAPALTPITTADYPTPARRPANSLLSTDRIEQAYGVTPRPWTVALPPLVAEILKDTR